MSEEQMCSEKADAYDEYLITEVLNIEQIVDMCIIDYLHRKEKAYESITLQMFYGCSVMCYT